MKCWREQQQNGHLFLAEQAGGHQAEKEFLIKNFKYKIRNNFVAFYSFLTILYARYKEKKHAMEFLQKIAYISSKF